MIESHEQKNDPLQPEDYSGIKSHNTNDWNPKDRRHRMSKLQKQIAWRRQKVAELDAVDMLQQEIADTLHVGVGTINSDLQWLREEARKNIQSYTQERLPAMFEKSLLGLTQIIRESWKSAANCKYERNKVMFMKLAEESMIARMDLASSADVIEKTAAFVARRQKILKQLQEDEWDETQSSDELPVPDSANSPIADEEPPEQNETAIEVYGGDNK